MFIYLFSPELKLHVSYITITTPLSPYGTAVLLLFQSFNIVLYTHGLEQSKMNSPLYCDHFIFGAFVQNCSE